RKAWFLIPWEAIRSADLGNYYNNPAVAVWLDLAALPDPLPTYWPDGTGEEERTRAENKLRRGLATAQSWVGTNALVRSPPCGLPPGVSRVRLLGALAEPAERESLPEFLDLARGATDGA